MVKLAQVSFASGEVAPSLYARVDLNRYSTALRTCSNYFVRATGGVSNRSGTRYVATIGDPDRGCVLIPFVYSVVQAYMLEFGEEYIRVYANGAQVGSDVVTPYQFADLAQIRFTQSADVLTIVHSGYPPAEFRRLTSSSFAYTVPVFTGGPFRDDNSDEALTLQASAATGSVTLTASAALFNVNMVGSLIRLDEQNLADIPPWEPSKRLAAAGVNPFGLQRRANGKVYRLVLPNAVATGDGTFTGTVRPSHDEGIETDGDGNTIVDLAQIAGVSWEYVHSGFGIAQITGYTSTTQVTATVLTELPASAVSGTTNVWALGAWSLDQGYPSVVTYYQDRLVFANSPGSPQTEWASKVGDYHNFSVSFPLTDQDAITQTLNARQVNAINELVPLDQLVALTANSAWASPRRGEVWTAETIGFDPQSYDGAAFMHSVLVGDSALYVDNNRTKVRDLKYSFDIDKFSGSEITVLSRHLFSRTLTIVDIDYAREPHGILWAVRSDGTLIGVTYLREQEVIGAHRHTTDGTFERVCVIPENGEDTVYLVVKRTINGATTRFLERFAPRDVEELEDYVFLDASLSFDGRNTSAITVAVTGSFTAGSSVSVYASGTVFPADEIRLRNAEGEVRVRFAGPFDPTFAIGVLLTDVPVSLYNSPTTDWSVIFDEFSGLDHLEGKTVSALVDGSAVEGLIVTGGTVTLQEPAERVVIGLPYVPQIETLDLNIVNSRPIRDSAKLIPALSILVQDTVGLEVGSTEDNLETIPWREDEALGVATQMRSQVMRAYIANTWNSEGRIIIRQSSPLPSTILAIIPDVKIGAST